MVYKLWHKLFGWDYIHWDNFCDSEVSRVRIDGNGNPFYYHYNKYVHDFDTTTDKVTWLTCNKSKYLWPKKED